MTRVDLARTLLLLITLAVPQLARAQSPEAEMLFREGRKLIKAGSLEAGCDKIEASEKLESSVGTLLNLGDCREKLGKIASAWAAFRKAEDTAKSRGRDEKRRNEASKRALALEPKLSMLAIRVPSITGIVVSRDNEVLDQAAWNTPVPLDPDTYTIVAEAPGYKPWRTEVVLGKSRRQVLTVPSLERAPVAAQPRPPEKLGPTDLPIAPPPVVVAPVTTPVIVRETPRSSSSTWTTARKVAVGIGVAGVVAAGTGVYFGLRAKQLDSQSNEICPTDVCDDSEGLRLNDKAQAAARNANILYALGGVAVATSVVVWVIGKPDTETKISPNVGRDHVGVSLGGSF